MDNLPHLGLGPADIPDCVELLKQANAHGGVIPETGVTSKQILQVWREMTFTMLAAAEAVIEAEETE